MSSKHLGIEEFTKLYLKPLRGEPEVAVVADDANLIRTLMAVDFGSHDRTAVAMIRRDHLRSVTVIDALSHFMTKMEKAPEPMDYLKDIELPIHVQPFRPEACRYKIILAMVVVMRGVKS